MYSQFIKEFVNVIYRFCDNNVIVIRKKRRIKKSFEIFVKYIFVLFFIVILKKINLFSSYSKSFKIIIIVIIYFYNMHSNSFFIRLKTITFNVFNLIVIITHKLFNIDFNFNFNK